MSNQSKPDEPTGLTPGARIAWVFVAFMLLLFFLGLNIPPPRMADQRVYKTYYQPLECFDNDQNLICKKPGGAPGHPDPRIVTP